MNILIIDLATQNYYCHITHCVFSFRFIFNLTEWFILLFVLDLWIWVFRQLRVCVNENFDIK